jgi:hypothetical protein
MRQSRQMRLRRCILVVLVPAELLRVQEWQILLGFEHILRSQPIGPAACGEIRTSLRQVRISLGCGRLVHCPQAGPALCRLRLAPSLEGWMRAGLRGLLRPLQIGPPLHV